MQDPLLMKNPKAFFTSDFIQENLHIPLAQIMLTRSSSIYQVGSHTFTHMTQHWALRNLIANPGKCSITFSIGNRLDIVLANKISSLALRSPQRVHIHIGTVRMTLWKKKLKLKLKVRNLLRTSIVTLNKVCDMSLGLGVIKSTSESWLTHMAEKFLNKNTGITTFSLESTLARLSRH